MDTMLLSILSVCGFLAVLLALFVVRRMGKTPNGFEQLEERGRRWTGVVEGEVYTDKGNLWEQRKEEYLAYIEADLDRTFPEDARFDAMREQGMLKRVLVNVSSMSEKGYVQGMNEVAAAVLLHLPEAAAEPLLLKLLHAPKYSLLTVLSIDPQKLTNHFDTFLSKYLPHLSKHFTALQISSVYYVDWFSTLFLHVAPLDEALTIFDAFIKDGWVAIYKAALCIMTILQPRLLKKRDTSSCILIIRSYRWDPSIGRTDWKKGTAKKALKMKVKNSDVQWQSGSFGFAAGSMQNINESPESV